ncbi:hypothetical protein B5807_06484 [Epicoccum nigrum]|uniref:Uncharacterized protein n=1 Tax=Epicoccum nigrum TaxID=105696 RepID=A0A1Y2LV90_EPING|nr:hypothetical protein B5807_06484 [Epicoccum nigrum]
MASATKYNASIPTAVDGCGRSFLSLAESLRSPSRFADQVASEAILDEFDRFKLWAGNIAAHRKGRRSLEHRLRDASQLKAETLSLLTSLSKALNHGASFLMLDQDTKLSDLSDFHCQRTSASMG